MRLHLLAGRLTAVAVLSLAAALSGLACSQGGSGGATTAPPGTTSSAGATATATGARPMDEAKPLYPIDGSEPDPLALRFCQAVHDTEAQHRGDCCGAPGDKGRFTGECARTLSSALRSKAV